MSDLAKWKVHGPVKTLKSEFATWDQDRQDWHPDHRINVASFDPVGTILSTDAGPLLSCTVKGALKLLQSEGVLTIASTGKDARTGRLITHQYRVEGPVMIFLTTTAIDLDEQSTGYKKTT